jgi:sporulation protein YlmC with PRC-barrel domain
MQGTQIYAIDGELGNLKDVYFDDTSWKVQYFVVELGSWFTGKEVLVPPEVVLPFDGNSLEVSMTKAELKLCPYADSAIPVSLQQRYRQRSLFELASSAGALSAGGPFIVPPMSSELLDVSAIDPHLRSCNNITGYAIVAIDGEIGNVEDFLVDDAKWLIRFMIGSVNNQTINEYNKKLFKPQSVEEIVWQLSSVKICMHSEEAQALPFYNPLLHSDIAFDLLEKNIMPEGTHE